MNGCPPKPVCTLMTSNMSISPRYGATASNGVPGSNESPVRMPSARISSSSGRGSPSSMWIVQPSAPASAKACKSTCGLSTIRWQSRNSCVCGRNDFTTGGPIVRFGT